MPLNSYGVLSGAVAGIQREGQSDTPHYQIELVDDDGVHYRVAVNVESQETPSELRYCVVEDFRHPITAALPAGSGWTPLPPGPGGNGLDFIRGNLFDPATLRVLPPDVTGPDNDLADLLDHYVLRAKRDPDVRLHVFGERWGPEDGVPDKVFGFLPGNGVHDVHMNQGNSGAFRRDDGVWQDGGLLLHFGAESRWVAIFLAFQSQSWHTDDTTGHAIDGGPGPQEKIPVRVVGALVNPVGPAPEAEQVTLLNASPSEADLTGWRLADRAKNTCAVPATRLAAGATVVVPLTDGVQLGNNGGAITLLDPQGLKVHGVSYTAEQSHDEGWTLVF
ncbi:DUF2278 family protein [Amycolatopsis vastitatis]|uniref:LTD domain-containing protein n=1 Tax=Amycolatopsis vastitatis TaxID=1905142 RepID=A0A229TF53_9PSEU|nr:DUF2278 family protein [Amycolatopsis vastitatis]OXM69798.1 hypothetical protein CF165_09880 [Amycolatopsis vastitatis]